MTLPKVLPSRLQRVVADAEFDVTLSFVELCKAVAATSWAQSFGFDAYTLAQLIIHHKTETKAEHPAEAPKELQEASEPEPVAPAPVQVMPPPAPTPESKPEPPITVAAAVAEDGMPVTVGAPAKRTRKKKAEVEETVLESVKAQPEPEKMVTRTNRPQMGSRSVSTPAGPCPHRLEATDLSSVHVWAERCRSTFVAKDNAWLTLHALKFFVREFHGVISDVPGQPTPGYIEACNHLDELYLGS